MTKTERRRTKNAAIAEKVFLWVVDPALTSSMCIPGDGSPARIHPDNVPNFAAKIGPAWSIMHEVRTWHAPRRQRFLECLRERVSDRLNKFVPKAGSGANPDVLFPWPDAVLWLKPGDICDAALAVLAEEGK